MLVQAVFSPARASIGISAFAVCCFMHQLGANALRSLGGWHLYLGSAAMLLSTAIILFIRLKPRLFKWSNLPKPLVLFLFLMLLSISWSAYRFESLLGFLAQLATTIAAVILATLLTWLELLRTLGTALRYLLSLSLVFELLVALLLGKPLLMGFIDVPESDRNSILLHWSRALLFTGGPIQGVIANSALLGFLGLLGLIIFTVQLRDGLVRPFNGWLSIFLASVTLLLTRSATVWVCLFTVIITWLFVWWARRAGENRRPVYTTGVACLVFSVVVTLGGRGLWPQLLGKSSDLTGRVEIWEKVSQLAAQRPVFGWGWISHWAPWIEPFKSLDRKVGLQVMHAHNAWLDVWLQLGWFGVLIFTLLVLLVLQRVWCHAVDRPCRGAGIPLPYTTSSVFPLLLLVALLTQSLTESRLLMEGNWLILILLAVKCCFDHEFVMQQNTSKPSDSCAGNQQQTPGYKQVIPTLFNKTQPPC